MDQNQDGEIEHEYRGRTWKLPLHLAQRPEPDRQCAAGRHERPRHPKPVA